MDDHDDLDLPEPGRLAALLQEALAGATAASRSPSPRAPAQRLEAVRHLAPSVADLCHRYLRAQPDLVYGRGSFHRYRHGLWQPLPLDQLRAEILALARAAQTEGVRPTPRLLDAVVEFLRLSVAQPGLELAVNPDSLPCRNGLLHLPTGRLVPHEPGHFSTRAVPYDYDPASRAPAWHAFLNSTVPEAAPFLQEFAGLALTPHTHFEVALWLYGPPGSGKSTFLHGLHVLLGPRAGTLALGDLLHYRLDPAQLGDKTLLTAAEHPPLDLPAADRLNALISGEPLIVPVKHRAPVQFRSVAKLAWAFTSLPRLADPHSGLFRRLYLVPFPTLPAERRDPRLKARLQEEGPGLLNWAQAGLARLLERGRFDPPPLVVAATERYLQSSDLPAQFVAEYCETGLAHRVRAGLLYQAYVAWCLQGGHRPPSSTALARDWERLGFERRRVDGRSIWHGLRLVRHP